MKVEVEDTWKQVEWQCRTFSVAHGGFWQNHETSHGDWKVYQILVADLLVWFLLNLSWFYWILLLGSDKSILSCRLLKVDLWSPFQPLSQGHSMQWCPGQCSDAFVWWVSMRLSFKMFRVYNHTSPVMSIDLIYLFPDNCREHGRQSEWMVFAQQPQGLGSEGFKAPRYLWHHNTSLFRNQLLGHKPCEELFMSKQERFGLAHSQRFCTCNEWLRLDLYFVVRFVNCETGCTCSVGLGPTQLVAKLATKARARNHADFVACFEILNADFGSTEFQLKASFNYWRRASQTGCVESWMKRHEQCCVNACWGSAECWKWLQYVETWRQTFLIWCFASCTPVTTYKRQRAGTIYIYNLLRQVKKFIADLPLKDMPQALLPRHVSKQLACCFPINAHVLNTAAFRIQQSKLECHATWKNTSTKYVRPMMTFWDISFNSYKKSGCGLWFFPFLPRFVAMNSQGADLRLEVGRFTDGQTPVSCLMLLEAECCYPNTKDSISSTNDSFYAKKCFNFTYFNHLQAHFILHHSHVVLFLRLLSKTSFLF